MYSKLVKLGGRNTLGKNLLNISLEKRIKERKSQTLGYEEIDTERLANKNMINSLKSEKSAESQVVQTRFDNVKQLSYINNIREMEKYKEDNRIEYRNMADVINQKYDIKKVEGNKNSVRTGLLGYKVGMTGVWDRWGTWFPLTVIKIDRCQVTYIKTFEKNNYLALQLGAGSVNPGKMKRPEIGHLIKNDLPPKRDLKEFRITPENILPIGYMLTVRHFIPGQLVDVQGLSKGRGYSGVMKRWNFSGGFATHGASIKHRGGV